MRILRPFRHQTRAFLLSPEEKTAIFGVGRGRAITSAVLYAVKRERHDMVRCLIPQLSQRKKYEHLLDYDIGAICITLLLERRFYHVKCLLENSRRRWYLVQRWAIETARISMAKWTIVKGPNLVGSWLCENAGSNMLRWLDKSGYCRCNGRYHRIYTE